MWRAQPPAIKRGDSGVSATLGLMELDELPSLAGERHLAWLEQVEEYDRLRVPVEFDAI